VILNISKENDAPNLKNNWDKVVKTAYISIDPGYRRALAQVKLEYPPLWEEGVTWEFELHHLGDNQRAVDFSPNGKYIVTGDDKGYVSIWDVSSGRELRQTEHSGTVYGVAFSPDGEYFATADSDYVNLLRVDNGKLIWQKYVLLSAILGSYKGDHYEVSFSPDGKYLATGNERGIVVNRVVGASKLWGKSRSRSSFFWGSYPASFYAVSYSPDGKYLATGDSFGAAILWDARNGEIIHLIEHADNVLEVDFSADGKYLVTGDNAGNVSVCEVSSGQILQEFPHDDGWVGAVAFSPDGKYFAVGHVKKRITFYRMEQGEIRLDSEIVKEKSITTSGPVYELAWHPNGNLISDGKKVYRTLLQSEEVSLTPPSLLSSEINPVEVGTTFTLNFSVKNISDLAGWQLEVAFNPDVLSVVEVKEVNFLKSGGGNTFFRKGDIDNTAGKITNLSAAILGGGSVSGEGTLFSITFEAKAAGDGELQLQSTQFSNLAGQIIPHEVDVYPVLVEGRPLVEDVNRDKVVNIQDLVLVASRFGQAGRSNADVNGDRIVNIQDLVLVAAAFGTTAAAPALYAQSSEMLTTADVKQWLTQAQQLNLTDVTSQRGILFLEQLLTALTPKETGLLPNYPNPFNPETWIPYQLAEPADVKISIYAVDGKLVRTLSLGHQPVGIYQGKNRAAYWDGKNEIGENVASGVYFYTLTAGEFTATRKMLIRK
jgi:WD40 repeat protein